MTNPTVRIGDRLLGGTSPVFVIAEAGVNHNGDVRLALDLVDAAAQAGADAVKFQAYVTEQLITARAEKAGYQVATTGSAGSQYDMLKAIELGPDAHAALAARCHDRNVLYLCTPYDEPSVELLERLGVAAFKIASTDTTNVPLLRRITARPRPVLLSTGMSTQAEVETAVQTLKAGGLEGQIVLLQCTSEYPAPVQDVNLKAIGTLSDAFGCPVGFSDHTEGIEVAPWAVAAGACTIEKHMTLDRTLPGPDHRASLEPMAFASLVTAIRRVEQALGDGVKQPMPSEHGNRMVMRKSLVVRRPVQAGHVFDADDLTCKRPAGGLEPSWFDRVVGQVAAVDLDEDDAITLESVRWDR